MKLKFKLMIDLHTMEDITQKSGKYKNKAITIPEPTMLSAGD